MWRETGSRGTRHRAGPARGPDRRERRAFPDGIERLAAGDGRDEAVPLLLLEVSQILLAGAQLGATTDVILPSNLEPEVGDDPDLDALRVGPGPAAPGLRRLRGTVRPVRGHAGTAVPPVR